MIKLIVKNSVLSEGDHYLTSDYKMRNRDRKSHNGMDFVSSSGVVDVIAIESGKVSFVGYDKSGGGYWISINTNGIEHRYFHLDKNNIYVKKGDVVKKGSKLARMGKSGNATNYNLHFAIYKKGYMDPLPFLTNDNPFSIEDAFLKFRKELKEVLGATEENLLDKTITISMYQNWNHKAVRVLQEYLKSLGYDLGKYGVDGKFGKDMKVVIKNYQKNVVGLSGVLLDGIITAKKYTWKKLLSIS